MTDTDDAHRPPTPRWVKVSGVVALVALALFVVLHLTGGAGGGLGPGIHGLGALS
ncbi:hypothetical protein [Streptomyces sp. TRM64462]|uniref:hypothetical protein n=1 Tax=Streptomyces sp. TRM64462 TaxID=2741726 RepID=UPI001586D33E|nr:hypothetical protein [Streptomyces sp. TRM64462]